MTRVILALALAYDDFLQTMLLRADGWDQDGYAPWWHGWALREAFYAGYAERDQEVQRLKTELEQLQAKAYAEWYAAPKQQGE